MLTAIARDYAKRDPKHFEVLLRVAFENATGIDDPIEEDEQ